jgi:glucose/mannose-6-phosphate isomerase
MSEVFLHPLDTAEKIEAMNSVKFWRDLPEQCEDALRRARGLKIPDTLQVSSRHVVNYVKPGEILIVGMGGSAIGGSILKDWVSESLAVPLGVCRDYRLPLYAGRESLVIAVSYSGNTEETLSSFVEALRRGCMVVAVTSGGILGDFCRKLNVPVVELPSGMVPRSAIAYLFFPLVVILEKFGLVSDVEEELQEAVEVLRRIRDEVVPEVPITRNRSKRLAAVLSDSIPVIYGDRYSRAIAYRSRTQFNENSKLLAVSGFLSEIDHNDVVGWEAPEEFTRQFSVVFLRTTDDIEEMKLRYKITRDLIADKAKRIIEVFCEGNSLLAKMLSVMYTVDAASIYLAVMHDIDPLSMKSISALKSQLAARTKTMDRIHNDMKSLLD